MTDQNIIDKSMRSVFVGNIPYEITEENLKDTFNKVGPVISFKLVYDKDTGKPKGYGFCEYKDQETALRAMRYLNGYEIGGRPIHVDNACTEKSRQEIQSLMMRIPTSKSRHGNAVRAEKAPEIISNVVASLPPEQLHALMKQMKEYIQSNPVEARNMLLQNPQLGYALLQAQVLMKIVDPEMAETMLIPVSMHVPPSPHVSTVASSSRTNQPMSQIPNNDIQWPAPNPPMIQSHPHHGNMDWNHMNNGLGLVYDIRQPSLNQVSFHHPPPNLPVKSSQLFPSLRNYPPTPVMNSDNRPFGDMNRNHWPNNNFMKTPQFSVAPPIILRQPIVSEPRMPLPLVFSNQTLAQQLTPGQPDFFCTEKVDLIMQVLQLTDAQISILPVEDRQRLIQLREKITLSFQKD